MIETANLLLRPLTVEDFSAYAEFWAESSQAGDLRQSLPVLTKEETWARLLRWQGHWHVFGFGPFAVIDRASGNYCGEVGLAHFKRGQGEDFDAHPEAMWRIANAFQGRGYAMEAVTAALGWFDDKGPQVSKTVCMIDSRNLVSQRVANRVGFRAFAERPYKGAQLTLFERTSSVQSG